MKNIENTAYSVLSFSVVGLTWFDILENGMSFVVLFITLAIALSKGYREYLLVQAEKKKKTEK